MPLNETTPEPTDREKRDVYAGCFRLYGCFAFMLLLGGYLIFNRSFATLGIRGIYVGEWVLALGCWGALFEFKTVFIEPLKRSRTMQLIAAFLIYGVIRMVVDMWFVDMNAARDSVCCLYAIAAFLGPWLLSGMKKDDPKNKSDLDKLSEEMEGNSLALVMNGMLAIFCVPAILWGWCIYLTWLRAPSDVKVDFLTLSAAVASTIYLRRLIESFTAIRVAVEMDRAGHEASRKSLYQIGLLFGKDLSLFLLSVTLVFCLPTRAIQPGVFMFAVAPFLITLADRGSRLKAIVVLLFVMLIGVAGVGAWVSRHPESLERVEALLDPDDSHFKTREGQVAANSVKWRLVFWRRCVEQTVERAPIFGLGFGINLTDLMRDTPDWPLFADSQNAAKYGSVNRHPHSAHITVFTRLGSVGLVIWLAVIGAIFVQGLGHVWRFRQFRWSVSALTETEIARRFNFLNENTLLGVWLIYLLAMSFGVVLENPFGGIWFWTLTGLIANRKRS